MKTPYPGYDVLAKWDSPSFDDKTRSVVAARLHAIPARRFFTEDEWHLVEALVARLIPQPDRDEPIPITPWIDEQLFTGRGEGFRHENMPPQPQAWRIGLAAIDGEAQQRHGRRFTELDAARQDQTLEAIAADEVHHALWHQLPAQRFFTDILLKTAAGIYYTHPAAWNEIGFGGPASPRGYVRLGFDERDSWEAKEQR
jgi:Gluconate 2-dehydrogenase subunit 3